MDEKIIMSIQQANDRMLRKHAPEMLAVKDRLIKALLERTWALEDENAALRERLNAEPRLEE